MCEWFNLITEINVFGKNFVMTGLPPPKLNFFSDFMWNRTILHSDYCAIVLICTYIHPFDRILDFSRTRNLKLLNHHYWQTLTSSHNTVLWKWKQIVLLIMSTELGKKSWYKCYIHFLLYYFYILRSLFGLG